MGGTRLSVNVHQDTRLILNISKLQEQYIKLLCHVSTVSYSVICSEAVNMCSCMNYYEALVQDDLQSGKHHTES